MKRGDASRLASDQWRIRWIIGFLLAVFLLGGSGRADVLSLAFLRPIAAIAFVTWAAVAWRTTWSEARGPALILLATGLLMLLHLIPLPPPLWTALPGRDIVVDTMAAVGSKPGWMPLTLAPTEGWNQFFALTVPAAMLLGVIWSGRAAMRPVLIVLLGIIVASALLGLLQSIGPAKSPLYLYRITNNGVGVGLFANRNHQAMLLACFYPLLAVWASTISGSSESQRAKMTMALGLGLAVVPLVFVAGSRSGLVLLLVGLIAAFVIYQRPQQGFSARGDVHSRRIVSATVTGTAVIMMVVAALSTRSAALQRILQNDAADDLRFQALPTIMDGIWRFFPWGSGGGSFVPVYKMLEIDRLLSATYFNHAHNDVAEVMLEYGLPGLLLIVAAVSGWAWAIFRLWNARRAAGGRAGRTHLYGSAGSAILLILGLGSVVDYPLRVPSLAALATLASVWIVWALASIRHRAASDGNPSSNRLVAGLTREI
ncbi:O-antigen ligase family protein [Sphingopyxis terrae]|uniref:O-antigen ligase family protein n=1 Tax=Sphingopyxis terrae TaxID=33052 RepID=UPI003F8174A5